MTGVSLSEAAIFGEALRRGCCVLEPLSDGESSQVVISIGVSSQQENANVPDLLRAADRALDEAKARGRSCVSQAPGIGVTLINGLPGVRIEDTALEEIGAGSGHFRLSVSLKTWHVFTSVGVDNLGRNLASL